MQPTYVPWSGFFNLISQVDVFVFLDDAQFEKSSWHNRNRVLLQEQAHWLSVPVRRLSLSQRINEVEVDDQQPWRNKHVTLLKQVYGKHPFASDMLNAANVILDTSLIRLSDLNITLITYFARNLGLTQPFYRSSELGIPGKRSDRLIDICHALGCDEYLSPRGSADYLEEDQFVRRTDTTLLFQNFVPFPYPQKNTNHFVGYLSILDVVANLGWQESARYIRGSVS
jgi:WbqC-like protein family.